MLILNNITKTLLRTFMRQLNIIVVIINNDYCIIIELTKRVAYTVYIIYMYRKTLRFVAEIT